jgi:hypothetical protein
MGGMGAAQVNRAYAADPEQSWRSVGGGDWNRIAEEGVAVSELTMILDSEGTPYVAYNAGYQSGASFRGVVKKYNSVNRTWEEVGTPFAQVKVQQISLAFDRTGVLHVAYDLAERGYFAQMELKKLQGGAWVSIGSSTELHSTSAWSIRSISMKFDQNNILYLLYHSSGYGVAVRRYDGTGWSTFGGNYVSPPNYSILSKATLHLDDSSGLPYAAYAGRPNGVGEKYRASVMQWSTAQGAWLAVADEFVIPENVISYASIEIYDNLVYLAYMDNTDINNRRIYVKKWNGTDWVDTAPSLSASNTPFSFLLTDDGTPCIAYLDKLNSGRVTVKRMNNDSEWVSVGEEGFSLGGEVTNNLLSLQAVDAGGEDVKVAYLASSGGLVKPAVMSYEETAYYTITFEEGEFGSIDPAARLQQVAGFELPASVPAPAPDPGYGFSGWLSSGGGQPMTTAEILLTPVESNITYTAQYISLAAGLDVTAIGIGAAADDYWKTRIEVSPPGIQTGNRRVYRNFLTEAAKPPKLGDTLTGYEDMPSNGIIEAANGHHIAVAEVNQLGQVQLFGQAVAMNVAGPLALDKPVLKQAVQGNGQVNLDWDPVPGATYYKIYLRDGFQDALYGTVVNSTTDTAYTVGGLVNGQSYYFAVQAVSPLGQDPMSNQVMGQPRTIPGAPANVWALAGDAKAIVHFTEPTDRGGGMVTHYVVTASPGGATATGAASPVTVSGLTNDVAYTFTVQAVHIAGSGPASPPSSEVTPKATGNGTGAAGYRLDMALPSFSRDATGETTPKGMSKGAADGQGGVLMAYSGITVAQAEQMGIDIGKGSIQTSASVARTGAEGQAEWNTSLYMSYVERPPAILAGPPSDEMKAANYQKNAQLALDAVAELRDGTVVAVGRVGIDSFESYHDSTAGYVKNGYGPSHDQLFDLTFKELGKAPGEADTIWSVPYHLTTSSPDNPAKGVYMASTKEGSYKDGIIVWMDGATGRIRNVVSLGGYGEDKFTAIDPTADGGFVAIGEASSVDGDFTGMPEMEGKNSFIVKYAANGDREWIRQLGGGAFHYLESVRALPGGGYAAVGEVRPELQEGETFVPGSMMSDYLGTDNGVHRENIQIPLKVQHFTAALLTRFDENGNLLWERHYYDVNSYSRYHDVAQSFDGSELVAVGEVGWEGEEQAGYGDGSMTTNIRSAFAHSYSIDGAALASRSYSDPSAKLLMTESEARPNILTHVLADPEGGYWLAGQASALANGYDPALLAQNGNVKGGLDMVVMKTDQNLEVEWLTFAGSWMEEVFGSVTMIGDAETDGLFSLTDDGFVIGANKNYYASMNQYNYSGSYVAWFTTDEDGDGVANSRDFYPLDPGRSIPEGDFAGWLNLNKDPVVIKEQGEVNWSDIKSHPPTGDLYGSYDVPNVSIRSEDAVLTAPIPVLDRLFGQNGKSQPLIFAKTDSSESVLQAVYGQLQTMGYHLVGAYDLGVSIGGGPITQFGADVKVQLAVTDSVYADLRRLYHYDGMNLTPVESAGFAPDSVSFTTNHFSTYVVAENMGEDVLEAKSLRERINALPSTDNLKLEDQELLSLIRLDYEALSGNAKELITNYYLLVSAEARMAVLQARSDAEAALAVSRLLEDLPSAPDVTLNDEGLIQAARISYDLLTSAQKGKLSAESVGKLTAAEARIVQLKEAAVTNEAAAAAVAELINGLPMATLADKAAVTAARLAYDALTSTQKPLVPAVVLAKLATVEANIARLEAEVDAVVQQIADLPEAAAVTLNDKSAVVAIRLAYTKLTEEQKGQVPQASTDKLTAIEEHIRNLEQKQNAAPLGGGGGGMGGAVSTPKPAVDGVVDVLDRELGKVAVTEDNGSKQLMISIDSAKLKAAIENLEPGETGGPVIAITVPEDYAGAIGELDGETVKLLSEKQAVLEIATAYASYTLPAQQIDIASLSRRLGGAVRLQDIKVQVEITAASAQMLQALDQAAKDGGFTLLAAPLNFSLKAVYGASEITVDSFGAYVKRRIVLPEGTTAAEIATGALVNAEGSVRHVPTKVEKRDGRYVAVISSLGNSVYTVIGNERQFADITGHWAKSGILEMASRMVIEGGEDKRFAPDREITRGEFAALLSRGLGLSPLEGAGEFADIGENDWYNGEVRAAYARKLISGYEDGTFRPDDPITREAAMVMIARAMSLAGLDAGTGGAELLAGYNDAGQVSEWAKPGVGQVLQAGLVNGREAGELAPQSGITRGEVAVIIQRLLVKAGLI